MIARPDFGIRVGANGQASAAVRVPPGEISRITRQLTSNGRQFGSAPRRPTDALAVRSGLGTTQGALTPAVTPSLQPQNIAGGARVTTPASVLQNTVNETIQQAVTAAQARQTQPAQPPTPPRPPDPPPPPPPQPPSPPLPPR